MRITERLILYCVPLSYTLACHAGDPVVASVPSQGPQIMLYFHQPLGASGASRTYGLRIEQASIPSTSPSASSFGGIHRREILNFEIASRTDMHLKLGRRLTWDVGQKEFGLLPLRPSPMFSLPVSSSLRVDPVSAHPQTPPTLVAVTLAH
jgi:hypothetical protein